MIKYISTRGGGEPQTFEQVLLQGLAPDGGLYVPQNWPRLDLESLRGQSYIEIAEAVMFPFVEGCIERDEFRKILEDTYGLDIFRHTDVVPLRPLIGNIHILELFHGPTIAFKDVALQLLGRLFNHVLKRRGEHVTIVGATSGDTGSAAIEGCRHSNHVNIFILHPHGRVSDVQRKQMTTVDTPHVHNIALEGTFDDCQDTVKALFNDHEFRDEMNLSAVNSINWARIMAQIVYYVTSALQFNEPASFVVPTGNFGNIFAAYCAQKMGVPIKTLAIATNRNDILTRFFETGEMKKDGVHPTISPSMDIQISSNFERYLYFMLDQDSEQLRTLMEVFQNRGIYTVPLPEDRLFKAFRCDDKQTLATIKMIHQDTGYTLDPHTAVGMHGALQLSEQEPNTPIISLACAHPAKFPNAVKDSTGIHPDLPPHLFDLFEKKERVDVLANDIDVVKTYILEKQKTS